MWKLKKIIIRGYNEYYGENTCHINYWDIKLKFKKNEK